MGLRETLNRHSRRFIGVSGGIVAILLVFIYCQLRSAGRPPLPTFPDKAFFTIDDGSTWFADADTQEPPYEHGGKEAVRAHVFSCDGGKHAWVQFLEKYNETAKQQLAAPAGGGNPSAGLLVKKPGDKDWTLKSTPQGQALVVPRCPNGENGRPEELAA